MNLVIIFLGFILFIIIFLAVFSIDGFNPILNNMVTQNMDISGVEHEVTAVLLNFRSIDTMLEIAVILSTLVGIYTVYPHFRYRPLSFASNITDTFVSLIVPLIFLSAIYILSIGVYKSGGAFPAAALIAGGIIIIKLVKPNYLVDIKISYLRFVYSFGLLVFVFVGILCMFDGYFLQYDESFTFLYILLIETSLTLSLGAILAAFFITGIHRFKT